MESELSQAQQKLREVEVALAAAESESARLAAEKKEQGDVLTQLQSELAVKKDDMQQLRAEVQRKDLRDVEERDRALQVLRQRAEELEAMLLNTEKQLAQTKASLHHSEEDVETAQGRIAALSATEAQLRNQNATLSEVLQQKSEALEALRGDYGALERLCGVTLNIVHRSRVMLGNEVWVGSRGSAVVGLEETARNMGLPVAGSGAAALPSEEAAAAAMIAAAECDAGAAALDLRVVKPVKVLRDLLRSAGYKAPTEEEEGEAEKNEEVEQEQEHAQDSHITEGSESEDDTASNSSNEGSNEEAEVEAAPRGEARLDFSVTSASSAYNTSSYSTSTGDIDS
ncbi:unnamed protein product, partial [Symbiodinium sp. KB8]